MIAFEKQAINLLILAYGFLKRFLVPLFSDFLHI